MVVDEFEQTVRQELARQASTVPAEIGARVRQRDYHPHIGNRWHLPFSAVGSSLRRPFGGVTLPRLVAVGLMAIAVIVAATVAISIRGTVPSSAEIRQRIATASTLSNGATTIHIAETSTLVANGTPRYVYRYTNIESIQPSSGLRQTVFSYPSGYYLAELENRTTGYFHVSLSSAVSADSPGWFSFPLGTVKDPAPVPTSSPGGAGGVSGTAAEIGTKEINGVKVTGYSYTVSVPLLVAQSTTDEYRELYETNYLDQGVRSFPGQVWVDSSGRIRELWWKVTYPRGYSSLGTVYNTLTHEQIRTYSSDVLHVDFPAARYTAKEATESQAFADARHYAGL